MDAERDHDPVTRFACGNSGGGPDRYHHTTIACAIDLLRHITTVRHEYILTPDRLW